LQAQCQARPEAGPPLENTGEGSFHAKNLVQIARASLRFSTGANDLTEAEVHATIRPLSELLFGKSLCI